MNIETVKELIASLESAGEPSIREQKFLKLAKAYQQLAAENVELKSKGKELLGEACAVYSRLNKLIDPSIGDFVDGQMLHEFQFVLDAETPATDRIVAGIKADEVEEEPFGFVSRSGDLVVIELNGDRHIRDGMPVFVKELREGAGK
ncbi:hypothetical protein [Klebsiella pneumoniae]|uniref:hypothetical protein n=1 Tax=Klebsiella pneumoniae TaxID=573 RepID=UPI0018F829C7|nr:hypothetical protein [Klebsiella pneumoniae]MBZ4697593.1 hypothetical protein [Klebsiella pneumoniae]HDU1609556.1 hypothetical protein [Klebsiella pneumoniae]